MRPVAILVSSALLSVLCAPGASAQNETVTVTGEELPGLWSIGFPAWSYSDFLKYTFGPVHDDFCRLAGTRGNLSLACLYVRFRANGNVQRGAVTLSGNRLHIAWGSLMVQGALDLTRQPSGIFTGYFTTRFMFVPFRAPDQLTARKIVLSDNMPDSDGKSALLAGLLNDIIQGTPMDAPLQLREGITPPAAADLRPLGRLERVVFMGRTPSSAEEAALYRAFPKQEEEPEKGAPPPPPQPPPRDDDASSVYAAEFENGERLCVIYQRPDGVVEDLRCV